MLRPGMEVICVDGKFNNPNTSQDFQELPKEGEKYHIREIRPAGAEGGVLLDEIKNDPIFFPHFGGKLEPAFDPRRFQPVVKEEVEEFETAEALI